MKKPGSNEMVDIIERVIDTDHVGFMVLIMLDCKVVIQRAGFDTTKKKSTKKEGLCLSNPYQRNYRAF
jgi:hypothetical protein